MFFILANCHTCSNSTYNSTCYNCNTTNNLCTITCDCDFNFVNYTTSITLQQGLNFGCELTNLNGNLSCNSLCPWFLKLAEKNRLTLRHASNNKVVVFDLISILVLMIFRILFHIFCTIAHDFQRNKMTFSTAITISNWRQSGSLIQVYSNV